MYLNLVKRHSSLPGYSTELLDVIFMVKKGESLFQSNGLEFIGVPLTYLVFDELSMFFSAECTIGMVWGAACC